MTLSKLKFAIISLSYVGLPLAVEFAKKRPVVGFDIKASRVAELQSGRDHTLEVEPAELAAAAHLTYTSDIDSLATCNVFIVTVPTPVEQHKQHLTVLREACRTIGRLLKRGGIVIYESTVYPWATEEHCVPELE